MTISGENLPPNLRTLIAIAGVCVFYRKNLLPKPLLPLILSAVTTSQTTFSSSAPAKINLLLAITGLRPDGFHSLVSLVTPISLCDTLAGTIADRDSLSCDAPGVPTDDSNLVCRATRLFREQVPSCPPIAWTLKKAIPHGAGLGGGSSDAASALMQLNAFCDHPLDAATMNALAAQLGSDVPLFLGNTPLIMRGRGEAVERLPENAVRSLCKHRFLLFKPAFGVSTAEAYDAMKRNAPHDYVSADEAEAQLAAWTADPENVPLPLFNNMERAVFRKHLALPALFKILRERHGLDPHMSGSGSACFAAISNDLALPAIEQTIREAWGESAFIAQIAPLGTSASAVI